MRKLVVWMVLLLTACSLMADVAVDNIKVQQRWPWNGLVDITYEVVSYDPDIQTYLYFVGKDNVRLRRLDLTTLTGDGAWGTTVKPGSYHVVWNAAKDYPGFHSADFSVTIIPCKTAEYEHYLVIDVSGGANASMYPYEYATTAPSVSSAVDKQSKIWLRYIPKGSFNYQGTTATTISKPYYAGVYEVTQGQYEKVMGNNPCSTSSSGRGASYPVHWVSYDMIRGSNWGREYGTASGVEQPYSNRVDSTSFMGRLRAKTGLQADLLTEVQWEYACRAGTTNNDTNVPGVAKTDVAWCYENSGNTAHEVGLKRPNAWNLYDMLGNEWEWCRDWYSSGYRVLRGGGWSSNASYATCAGRSYYAPSRTGSNSGFRLAVLPGEE